MLERKVITVTGHRPDRLPFGPHDGRSVPAISALERFAVQVLRDQEPDRVVTGMAEGWDQAVAVACVVLGIPFTAAVPFREQDRRWSGDSRERYHKLLDDADHVEVLYGEEFAAWKYMRRNEWMVNRAAEVAEGRVFALWDGGGGGTAHCVAAAESAGVPVTQLWGRWEDFSQERNAPVHRRNG